MWFPVPKRSGSRWSERPANRRAQAFDLGSFGVVRILLGRDPASGDIFVFKNRRGDKLKILGWMGDGFALYLCRLEKGTFAFPTAATPELTIPTTQLAMILRRHRDSPDSHTNAVLNIDMTL